jgi:hypothetical protein
MKRTGNIIVDKSKAFAVRIIGTNQCLKEASETENRLALSVETACLDQRQYDSLDKDCIE